MTDPTMFYLMQQANQLESEITMKKARLRTATTMRDVAHLSDVHVKPELRHMPNVKQAVQSLEREGERCMDALLEGQLKHLAKCDTEDELKNALGKLQRGDWQFMRGTYARILQKANRQAQRLLGKFRQNPGKGADGAHDATDQHDDEPGDTPTP